MVPESEENGVRAAIRTAVDEVTPHPAPSPGGRGSSCGDATRRDLKAPHPALPAARFAGSVAFDHGRRGSKARGDPSPSPAGGERVLERAIRAATGRTL